MKLITSDIMKKLKRNHAKTIKTGESTPIVLKLFGGSDKTWLINDIDDDGDTLWGLMDLGLGSCEFGTVSLSELKRAKFKPFGLGVERDRYFDGDSVQFFRDYYEQHNSLNGC